MDLAWPLAVVSPTLDAGVLQTLLASSEPMTAAEVHRRLARGSDEGVRRVLGRLVGQGVVHTVTHARYPVYWMNTDHVATPYLRGLADARAEILSRMADLTSQWTTAPLHVSTFGSFARADGDSQSDIDVLVVRPRISGREGEDGWLLQLDQFGRSLEAWSGNRAQILDVERSSLRSMARKNDPLVGSIQNEGVHVWGQRFEQILRGES